MYEIDDEITFILYHGKHTERNSLISTILFLFGVTPSSMLSIESKLRNGETCFSFFKMTFSSLFYVDSLSK